MKIRKLNIQLLLLTAIIGTLIILFNYKFNLRLILPVDKHYIIHIFIFCLLGLCTFLTISIVLKFEIKKFLKPLIIISFLTIIVLLLTFFNTSSRKTEISNYFVKNESSPQIIVDYYKIHVIQNGEKMDNNLNELMDKLSVRGCGRNFNINNVNYNKIIFLKMFDFIGYGYGIAYTDENNMKSPGVYHMSPMVEWYKIKDNWYYFAYFD